jgi:hypothetical protein
MLSESLLRLRFLNDDLDWSSRSWCKKVESQIRFDRMFRRSSLSSLVMFSNSVNDVLNVWCKTKIMMLLLTLTLLLFDDDIDNADDVDDVDDVDNANEINDVDIDDVNDKRKRKSSIEERKKSRLDTNLDRVERLVMCYFFASLVVSQAESKCR